MASRREPVEAVPILLNWLAKMKVFMKQNDLASGKIESNTKCSREVELLQKIEEKLQDMKDFLPQLKHWEETLMEEFTILGQDINDPVFISECPDKIHDKLIYIDQKLDRIHDRMKKIDLQPICMTSKKQVEEPLGFHDFNSKKLSDEWLRLGVEERLLLSPGMARLEESYDILDFQLKLCLLCFSIFPENCVIKKRPLIYWWIGEGFVTKTKDKTADEVGEEIFQKLVERDLIQGAEISNKKHPVINTYKIHPWIRGMLISAAKKAEFFDFDPRGIPTSYASTIRRACFLSGIINPAQKCLSTLFNVNRPNLDFTARWFSNLKGLVVLHLGKWQTSEAHHIEVENTKFLDYLGAHKHLKYLSLNGILKITKLPSSLVELIKLEILDLKGCRSLEKLPFDIGLLRNLTHLDVSECYRLEDMPIGLHKLSSLQVLKGFLVGITWKTPNCKLCDLAQLKQLRKLSVYIIGREDSSKVGELDMLKDIETLRILAITWESKYLPLKSSASISFPPNLEKLDLRCLPCWPDSVNPTELKNLKKLYIRGGDLDSLGPMTEDKWEVKILRLRYLNNLKVDWEFLLVMFPLLIYLEKVECHKTNSGYDQDLWWTNGEDTATDQVTRAKALGDKGKAPA